MKTKIAFLFTLLTKDSLRFSMPIIVATFACLTAAPAMAAEVITMEMESQVLDLDSGNVVDSAPQDWASAAGADVKLAYNADRIPHTVVFPVGEAVELAFIASVGYNGIFSSDIPNLVFSSEPIDMPFSANDCVVIRTDQGAVFKLGNAVESGSTVTFTYATLSGGGS